MSDVPPPAKLQPRPSPKTLTVTDNLPRGAELKLSDAAIKSLVRLFGEEALRRVGLLEKGNAGGA